MSFHYILNPPRTLKEMGMKIFVKTVLFQLKQHNSIFQASFDHFFGLCEKHVQSMIFSAICPLKTVP